MPNLHFEGMNTSIILKTSKCVARTLMVETLLSIQLEQVRPEMIASAMDLETE